MRAGGCFFCAPELGPSLVTLLCTQMPEGRPKTPQNAELGAKNRLSGPSGASKRLYGASKRV